MLSVCGGKLLNECSKGNLNFFLPKVTSSSLFEFVGSVLIRCGLYAAVRNSHLTEIKLAELIVDCSSDWDNDFSESHVLLSSFEFIGSIVYVVVHIYGQLD